MAPVPVSVITWASQLVVYHVVALAFEWCDRSGVIAQLKNRDADRKPYSALLPRVLANQFGVLLPSMVLAQMMGLCFVGDAELSAARFLISMPIMAIGHDVVQYMTHRYLLHRPNLTLMRLLQHSVHHSTGATKGVSACYMTGPDFFLEIVLPYLIPLAVVGGGGSDIGFHVLIAGLGAVGGIYEHSGYDFALHLRSKARFPDAIGPFRWPISQLAAALLDNRAHSEHHMRANVSFSDGFGSSGVMDTLLGTRWDMVAKRHPEAEVEWQTQRVRFSADRE